VLNVAQKYFTTPAISVVGSAEALQQLHSWRNWIIEFLTTELSKTENFTANDTESQSWLEADLVSDLPEYDWGEGGIPSMKSVEYLSGIGLVVKVG
jgi:hypothetical protein